MKRRPKLTHAPIEAWFDGCCEPVNPGGHAAYGALVKVNGVVVLTEGRYVGCGPSISNNVAEYAGCTRVLEEIAKHDGIALVRGDSKLVVNQLMGRWKIHGGLYVPFYEAAKAALEQVRERVWLEWIPRELNDECDVLSKKVLKDMKINFRIQPELESAHF